MDYFESLPNAREWSIGVAGYGEGGLIAFYAAALDNRISASLVSGYFGPREGMPHEPVYRNVYGLLREFGDADIASLIAPRALVIEACRAPMAPDPPPLINNRNFAARGKLSTPALDAVRREFAGARAHYDRLGVVERISLVAGGEGAGTPGSSAALAAFLQSLDVAQNQPAQNRADFPPQGFAGCDGAHETAVRPVGGAHANHRAAEPVSPPGVLARRRLRVAATLARNDQALPCAVVG